MAGAAALAAPARRPIFETALPIAASAVLSAGLVGVMLTQDVQLGIALLAGVLYLPLALLNLPLAIALWVPLVYFEQWPPARFIPWGVGILLGLAWLGTLGGPRTLAARVLRRHRGTFVLVAAFLSWVTLSLAWATDPGRGAKELWVWLMAGAVLLVVATTISTRRQLVTVCGAFVVAALISVAIALPALSAEVAPGEEATRLGGSFQNPNYLAAGLLSAAILAAGLFAITPRASWRLLLGGAIAVMAYAILITGSRGGLIAAAVAVASAVIIARGSRLRVAAVLAVAAVAAGAWIASTSDNSIERLREFDTGGSGRIDLWSVAWRMSGDRPVLGVGYENFPVQSPNYISAPGQLERVDLIVETPLEVHNAYLGLLVETGVIGLALFIVIVIGLVRVTLRAASRFADRGDRDLAVLGRTIAVAQIGGLTALFFAENPANHQLWILLALGPVLLTVAERAQGGSPG